MRERHTVKREKHTEREREREVDSDSVTEKREERVIERLADNI